MAAWQRVGAHDHLFACTSALDSCVRSEPSQMGSITVWSMPLFTRKRTHEPGLAVQQFEPLPEPPEPDRGQLRSMQAHRQYLLSCIYPLRAFPPAHP